MKNYYLDIAGIKVKIESTNNILNQIAIDLDALESNEENLHFDILLRFNEEELNSYKAAIYSAKKTMNFNRSEFFVGYFNGLRYRVKNLFNDNAVEINITTDNKNLKTLLSQLYNFDFSDRSKSLILSYSIFWYIFHMVLIKKQKAFLHSGVFSKNGQATVIAGTGGCGKTSTLFKILEDNKTKYIAEDFGIIDDNAMVYYNPKPVSIYASDMEFGQKVLQDYHNKFTYKEKIVWDFKVQFLNKNPMVQVSPKKVMSDKVDEQSKVTNVLYFIRNNHQNITLEKVCIKELSERVLDASMRELKPLNELLLLMRANAPLEYKVPSFEDIRVETDKIYQSAFKHTNNMIVNIPYKTKPYELVEFLKNEGLF